MNFRSRSAHRTASTMMGLAAAWMASAGCSEDTKPEIDGSILDASTADARPEQDASMTSDKVATPDDVALTDTTPADKTTSADINPDSNCSCAVVESDAAPPLNKNGLLSLPCSCARSWTEFGGAPPACLSFDESIDCQKDYGRQATIETFKNCALVAVHFGTLGPDDRIFQSQTHELVGANRGTDHSLKCETSEVGTIRAGVLPAADCETAEIRPACPDAGPRPDASDVTDDRVAADGDAPTDADIVSQCRQLQADWGAFVQQHRSCTDVAECVVVGGAQACDCGSGSTDLGLGRPIGNASGDAIASVASTEAQVHLAKFKDLGCNYLRELCVYDAAPGRNLRCESGQCTLTNWSCLTPPDASFATSGGGSR